MTTAQSGDNGPHRSPLGFGACGTVQMARAAPAKLFCFVIKTLTYSATGMTLEYGMSWSETMEGNTTAASLEHADNDEKVVRRTQAWDPFDIWLTRIKQPRDNAAKSAPADMSSGIGDRRD